MMIIVGIFCSWKWTNRVCRSSALTMPTCAKTQYNKLIFMWNAAISLTKIEIKSSNVLSFTTFDLKFTLVGQQHCVYSTNLSYLLSLPNASVEIQLVPMKDRASPVATRILAKFHFSFNQRTVIGIYKISMRFLHKQNLSVLGTHWRFDVNKVVVWSTQGSAWQDNDKWQLHHLSCDKTIKCQ